VVFWLLTFISFSDVFLVPVYDARGCEFSFNAEIFDTLADHFPLLDGEIPKYSFAVVAYLTQVHKMSGKWHLFTYPVWVLLMASR
jgi:hypothetical protein